MRVRVSQTQMIFAGMVVGLAVGWLFPDFGVKLEPLGAIFIRLVKTIIVPIVFATLIVGIAGHGDLKAVGRMGVKAFVYFEVVTTFALGIGLLVVNVLKPGVGVSLEGSQTTIPVTPKQHSLTDVVVNIFLRTYSILRCEATCWR